MLFIISQSHAFDVTNNTFNTKIHKTRDFISTLDPYDKLGTYEHIIHIIKYSTPDTEQSSQMYDCILTLYKLHLFICIQ